MILYQLKAIGENACFDKLGANYSKRVFLTREEAEAYEPEFRSRCLTPQHTADLETLVNNDQNLQAQGARPMPEIYTLAAPGHVPCKKNRYRIAGKDRRGRPLDRPRFFKGTGPEEDRLCMFFRSAWDGKPPITTRAWVTIIVCYYKAEPDDVGVAETIYDSLQRAGVVANDRLLCLAGRPAIARVKIDSPQQERCVVTIEPFS